MAASESESSSANAASSETERVAQYSLKQATNVLKMLSELPHPKTVFDVAKKLYPLTLSLPEYVKGVRDAAMAQGIGKEAIAMQLVGMMSQVTQNALPVPQEAVVALLKSKTEGESTPLKPSDLLKLFKLVAPHALTTLFDGHNEMRDKDAEPDAKKSQWILPSTWELGKLDEWLENEQVTKKAELPPPEPVDAEKAPGLFKGTFGQSPHPLRQRAASVIMSEVFSRLMFNYSVGLPEGVLPQMRGECDELFVVQLEDGRKIVRLDEFCEVLLHQHQDASFETGIKKAAAMFGFSLSVQTGKEGVPPLEVPFTMFMRTGVISPVKGAHIEAAVPLIHTGLYVKFRSPSLDFDVEYYLGSGGNAKFRAELGFYPAWNQPTTEDQMTGSKAIESIIAAALYGNVIDSYAVRHRLYKGGYGTNGVCADSVAPIQQMMFGRCTVYPILGLTANRIGCARNMADVFVEIGHAIESQKDAKESDDVSMTYTLSDQKILFKLADAALHLPNDSALGLSKYVDTIDRILASIPWASGEEPFLSTTLSRGILESERSRHEAAMKAISSLADKV